MRNPFKKNNWHDEEHNDVSELIVEILFSLSVLKRDVQTLREEVDYLVDALDD